MSILEVCVDSLESAWEAKAGGADRLELCGDLIVGGVTPGFCLYEDVQAVGLPIHVLIRPRFGDFLYTQAECDRMCREIAWFADHGARAVVIGALHADGTLNVPQLQAMIQAAKGIHITLHRAFDVCRDPFEALETAVALGVDTILTSGQEASALEGKDLLAKLLERAAGRVEILIGAGVNAQVIRQLRRELPGATAFHLSGKKVLSSGMLYRNEKVNMGLPGIGEFEIWRTDQNAIREAHKALKE